MDIREYKRKEGFTYIYGLWPPGVEKIPVNCRYVGKAVDVARRFKSHLERSRNPRVHCHCWVKSLLDSGVKPVINVIAIVPNRVASQCEINVISLYKKFGANLTNLTDGGEGMLGHFVSDETRAKMSLSKIGNTCSLGHKHSTETKRKISAGNTGKFVSEETRKKMSTSKIGDKHPMYHKHRSEESNAKTSNSMIGKTHSREAIIKMSLAKMGHSVSDETRRKISLSVKRLLSSRRKNLLESGLVQNG
jgi:group I intron endonuclease